MASARLQSVRSPRGISGIINFRYHVVSLVAVFLALGTGTLVGSSFISRGTVAVLQASLRKLDASNRKLIDDVRQEKDQRETLQKFVEVSEGWIVQGRLKDRSVVLVTVDTTPDDVSDAVAQAVASSGARVQGAVQLTSKLDLSTQPKRAQVAQTLGSPSTDADSLAKLISDGLTASLSGKDPAPLRRLLDAGLATVVEVPQPGGPTGLVLEALGGPEATVIVLGGPAKDRSDVDDRLAGPLAQSLATLESPKVLVAAAEPGAGPFHVVGRLRDAKLPLVTADGVDEPMGRIQLILGLQAAAGGKFGDYGTGPGASNILPETPK